LSQVAFARRYGFTSAAVSAWEQGRKKPGRAARLLFALIAREPEAVRRALAPEIVETT
jgi:putative transcriptional regulator